MNFPPTLFLDWELSEKANFFKTQYLLLQYNLAYERYSLCSFPVGQPLFATCLYRKSLLAKQRLFKSCETIFARYSGEIILVFVLCLLGSQKCMISTQNSVYLIKNLVWYVLTSQTCSLWHTYLPPKFSSFSICLNPILIWTLKFVLVSRLVYLEFALVSRTLLSVFIVIIF